MALCRPLEFFYFNLGKPCHFVHRVMLKRVCQSGEVIILQHTYSTVLNCGNCLGVMVKCPQTFCHMAYILKL